MAARGPRQENRTASRLRAGTRVFCDQIPHRCIVERQLGIHPLELGVLGLKFLDPPKLGCFQAAVLALPLVISRHADADLATGVFDWHACIGLLERRDDLCLGELPCARETSWLWNNARKTHLYGVCGLEELTLQQRRTLKKAA